MTVRKKRNNGDSIEGVFEDVVKIDDDVIEFTLDQVTLDISAIDQRITDLQSEKDKLTTRKTQAEVL